MSKKKRGNRSLETHLRTYVRVVQIVPVTEYFWPIMTVFRVYVYNTRIHTYTLGYYTPTRKCFYLYVGKGESCRCDRLQTNFRCVYIRLHFCDALCTLYTYFPAIPNVDQKLLRVRVSTPHTALLRHRCIPLVIIYL